MKSLLAGLATLFNCYVVAFILIAGSCYVYLNWVAPWTYLYGIGMFVYLCVFVEHYTNPMNYVNEPSPPPTEWELEAAEFQRREDEWNDKMGYERDDPDYD